MSVIPESNIQYSLYIVENGSERLVSQGARPFLVPEIGQYFEYVGEDGDKVSGDVTEARVFITANSGRIDNAAKIKVM